MEAPVSTSPWTGILLSNMWPEMASCMRVHTGVTVASDDPDISLKPALTGMAQWQAEGEVQILEVGVKIPCGGIFGIP